MTQNDNKISAPWTAIAFIAGLFFGSSYHNQLEPTGGMWLPVVAIVCGALLTVLAVKKKLYELVPVGIVSFAFGVGALLL